MIVFSAKLQDAQTSLSLLKRDMTLLGETKLPTLIKDSGTLQVAKVLRGDYALKITRQDYFTSNQDQVNLLYFNNNNPTCDLLLRVPTQVLQSLIKSYICFSICKALYSLILGYFRPNRSYKVLFLIEKEVQH